jgi:hypothetical protein
MNYLPFIVFLLAVGWMIRQGYASKKNYKQTHKSQGS